MFFSFFSFFSPAVFRSVFRSPTDCGGPPFGTNPVPARRGHRGLGVGTGRGWGGVGGGGVGGSRKPQGEAAERRLLPDVLLKFLTPPLSLHKLPDPPNPSLRNLSLAGK